MAPPYEVEALAAYHALTPDTAWPTGCTGSSGKGCEETPGEEDVQVPDDDPALLDRCLKAARSALDNLFDEKTSVVSDTPVDMPVPVTAAEVFDAADQFALGKLDKYMLASGASGEPNCGPPSGDPWRRHDGPSAPCSARPG